MLKTLRIFSLCILTVLCFSPVYAPVHATAASIAKVIAVTEGATIERNGKSKVLALKDDVFINDIITTTATGKAQIIFNDDTIVSIGVNSKFYMSDYSDSERKAFRANVAEGFARFVTGTIVKANPDAFTVRTPQATAGIRGTIISILLENGQTLFMVEGSGLEGAPSVVVNGVTIEPGQMVIFGSNGVPISPPAQITPQQRQIIENQIRISLNQNASQEFITALGAAGVDGLGVDSNPQQSAGNNFPDPQFNKKLQGQLPSEPPLNLNDINAKVSGFFEFTNGAAISSGLFFFDANLGSGAITEVELETNLQQGAGIFEVEDATGRINAHDFVISGGEAEYNGDKVNDWNMTGNQTINQNTTQVDGSMSITPSQAGINQMGGNFDGTVDFDDED